MSVNLFSTIENFQHRLFTAEGVVHPADENYADDSIIPLYPLTSSFHEESTAAFDLLNSIYCFKITDNQFKGIVANLGIQDLESGEALAKLMREKQSSYELLKKKFLTIISKFMRDSDYTIHDIYMGGRNQATSTIDFGRPEKKKIGFHYDNWGDLPVSQLNESTNRLCINLGKGHRYFLFIDKTIFEMREELMRSDLRYGELEDSNELGKLYIKNADPASYKVMSVRLEPFEGYIAPTETIMHDGANFDSEHIDIQLTARGLFHPEL